jgi:hypothetical protein
LSKKRFKEGLESLFGEAAGGGSFEKDSPLLERGKEKKEKASTADFAELFKEKVAERIVEKVEENQEERESRKSGEEPRQLAGLDALIRKTLEKSKVEVSQPPRGQRRVTFVVDEGLLEKLRSIARLEKKYLRELVDGAVREFITNYESESGKP